MKRLYRIYIFSISGALGGLGASLLHQHLVLAPLSGQLEPARRYILLAFLGFVVGAAIGFGPSFVEGKGNYTLRRAFQVGLIGATFGGVAGLLAFPPAEWLHIQMNAGMTGRMIAFGLVGLAIGIAQGMIGGARPWRAIIGGVVGGAIAGWVVEYLIHYQTTYADSGIIALMMIGLFISLFISIFVNFLSDAWLEGQPGSKVEGQIYHLSKYRDPHEAVIGSGSGKKNTDIFIYIPDAEARHASITITRNGARIRHVANQGRTRIGNAEVREQILRDQDMIQIGSSKLKYRERRKAALLTPSSTNNKGKVAT
jgi:hypothetical protein